MRVSFACLLSTSVFLTPLLSAQIAATNQPNPYRDEPLVFERLDTTVTMRADGTGDTTNHIVLRVQSEGTARQFSVLSFAFASANEQGTFDYVRVHKADGTTVETPVDGSMEMPAEVTRDAPVYSDIKEKHLPVRSLSVGDRLEYQTHTTRTKAEAPNQFWGAEHFAVNAGVVLNQTVTLSVPASTYVQVWSPNHPAQPSLQNGNQVWQWTSAQTKPSSRDENGQMKAAEIKDPDEDSDGRKLPSVAWTTFHNWAEVGDWYRGLAAPRLEPTVAIRAKADELTKDVKTPQAQVEALYTYVSTRTRYVGISLGVGRYQPHAASDVLANQYGDCKDKDTLLESLLRAKGFTTASALIGAGIAPVAAVPTPAVFNHVITTVDLPGGRIWLDSTPEIAPFRMLSPVLRDQEALVVPATGPASLQKTPLASPFPYKVRADFVGTLDRDGHLKGHETIVYRSDAELVWRALARRASPAQWDEIISYMAPSFGYTGKATHADLRQEENDGPFQVAFDYSADQFYDWKNNNVIGLFPFLDLPSLDKDKAPEHDIDLGAPRTLEGHSVMTLPTGYRAELPSPLHVERPYAHFNENWKLTDGKLVVDRTVEVLEQKLSKDKWKDYLAFCKETTDKGEQFVVMIAPPAGGNVPATLAASKPNAAAESSAGTANDLLQAAEVAERHNDWAEARRLLTDAKAKDPTTPFLMSMLGWVALHDRKFDEAVQDIRQEITNHPDTPGRIIALLAAAYAAQDKLAEAVSVLQQYSSRNDLAIQGALASLQMKMGDNSAALTTSQALLQQYPDNKGAQQQVANLLYSLHRTDEAAAAAKKALDGSDDPYLINNEVYLLAEMKRDLPFAEESSKRSVKLLEGRTATFAVESANSSAFADSATLAASWDTLAYILLLQGKAAEAEPYFYSAWFNEQNVAVGNHLGQAYEALGRKNDALRMYELAVQTEGASNSPEDFAQVKASIARMEKAGVRPSAQPTNLQEMRTFHVVRPPAAQGGGTVRAQLSPNGIVASLLVTGDDSLKATLPSLQHVVVKGAVPPGSQARILRDGVLYCGKTSKMCDFVFMTSSGIGREGISE